MKSESTEGIRYISKYSAYYNFLNASINETTKTTYTLT